MEHSILNRVKLFFLFLVFIVVLPSVFSVATRDDAVAAIAIAESDIQAMVLDNLSVSSVSDSLVAANKALERADFALLLAQNSSGELADKAKEILKGLDYVGFSYDDVLNYTNAISERKSRAYLIVDSIKVLGLKIDDYNYQGVNTTSSEEFLDNAKVSFGKERYDEAQSFISSADSELESRKAEIVAVNVLVNSSKGFFERNWHQLLFLFVFFGVIGFFVFRKVRAFRLRKKLISFRAQKVAVLRLKKKAQVDRFKKRTLSGMLYNIKMDLYEKKLVSIEHNLPVLKGKLERYGLKDLKNLKD